MSVLDWQEEPIAKRHDRNSFDCGEPDLNEFLRKHARQSHERGAAKTFLAIAKSDGRTILGFYSLCPAALEYARAPESAPTNTHSHFPRTSFATFQSRASTLGLREPRDGGRYAR